MKIFNKNNAAYTLIEVLITIAIFTVMMGAIYSTLIISQRSWSIYADTTAPKQALRSALPAMARELRESQNLFITKDEHGVNLSFQRPKYGEIKYSWTDMGEDANKIVRYNYAHKSVLAYHIYLLSFVMDKNNDIIIEITAKDKKSTELRLKEKVILRSQTGAFAQSQNEEIK